MISQKSLEVMQLLAVEELSQGQEEAAYHLFAAIGLLSMKEITPYSLKSVKNITNNR